jgi:hypothetical protein
MGNSPLHPAPENEAGHLDDPDVERLDDADLEAALDEAERGDNLLDGESVIAELRAELEARWRAATG